MSDTEQHHALPATERTLFEGILHYLSILRKYRWLIIITTAATALVVVAFCSVSLLLPPATSPLPNTYVASAVVIVQSGKSEDLSGSLLAALGMDAPSADFLTGFDTGALLVLVLESRSFLDKVIEEFNIVERYRIKDRIKTRSRELLLEKSTFSYSKTTSTITISVEDIDPVFARDITNRIVTLLNEWFAQNIGSSTLRQKQLLEEKIAEVQQGMDDLENQLDRLQKRYGMLTASDLGTSQASVLASLRSQLILKEIDIKNYSTISAIEDPKLEQLRKERENILELIDQIQRGMPEFQSSTSTSGSKPDVQRQFNDLSVALNVQKNIYNTLSQQYEVVKLTSEPRPAFQILELAEIPDTKSGPQRSKIVAVAVLVAFMVSVAMSFFLNALRTVRMSREKVPVRKAPS